MSWYLGRGQHRYVCITATKAKKNRFIGSASRLVAFLGSIKGNKQKIGFADSGNDIANCNHRMPDA
jgi:hypothetical protein